MTAKKGGIYRGIIEKLKELVPALKPLICHCDYEKQEQDAMAEWFGCQVQGCQCNIIFNLKYS